MINHRLYNSSYLKLFSDFKVIVSRWIASKRGKKTIIEYIENKLSTFDQNPSAEFEMEVVRQKIKTAIGIGVNGYRPGMRIGSWRRIAAIIIPLFIAAGLWIFSDHTGSDGGIIARFSEEVILTLPDGSQIALDQSTDNSVIAKLDNIAFIQENGKLINQKHADDTDLSTELSWGTVKIPKGTMFDMVLEDGTQVWLNAGSYLRFPVAFVGDERRVYLEGEAYFAVTENAKKPFIVDAAGQSLKVLGTEFNIYAYPEEQTILTTLVSGSIEVTANDSGEQKIIAPGQQLQFDTETKLFLIKKVNTRSVASWRDGKFIFDRNTLGEVMLKLARWYNFEYSYKDNSVSELIVRGNIPICEDMSKVLRLIDSMDIATFEQKGNMITIKKKE